MTAVWVISIDLLIEYNLQDMTTAPRYFLSIFKSRVSTPLDRQLYEGVNGGPGDREMMEKYEKYAQRPSEASEGFTIFLERKFYGKSFTPTKAAPMPRVSIEIF